MNYVTFGEIMSKIFLLGAFSVIFRTGGGLIAASVKKVTMLQSGTGRLSP